MNALEIGRRIKERRLSLDLTQEQLSNPLGLNKSTIQRYEAGQVEKIKLPVLQEIAKILNVNPDWLACKTDEKNEYFTGFDALKEKEQPASEPPLTEGHKRVLASVTDLPDEDIEKVIDYALLLKKARNP